MSMWRWTHLSLSLAPGEFVTVIGSNGAGKSTLFSAIGGSFWADSGAIFLDGKNITYDPEHKRAAKDRAPVSGPHERDRASYDH